MKNLTILIATFFLISFASAQEFCPGNLFTNGDLEIGTPTAGDQDINNALGFSSIWPTGSLADYYAYNAGPFPPPLPADGDYAGLWISNNPTTSTTYREGLFNKLNTPLANSSGVYSFTFDIACLYGWGESEVGIYGIYNPTDAFSATPTASHTPSNENLFGPANTTLLGTVYLATGCDRNKTTQTISFDSGLAGFPLGGITHILLTHSDDTIAGAVYIGLDNFCMTLSDTDRDTCAEVIKEEITCDGNGYTYTYTVQNNTNTVVDGIIVNGHYDPTVVIPAGGTYGPLTVTIPAGSGTRYCVDIILFSENLACCHTTHCIDLPICNPCDSIDLVATSMDSQDGACCYEVDVINNFDDQYFTKIISTILTPGVNFDNPSGDNGWTVFPTSGNVLTWTPSGTYIDDISDPGVLNFCFKDINHISQTPQVVVFDWITTSPIGDEIVCSDTLTFFCEPCMNIENDEITCLSDGTYNYCFTVTNNSTYLATELYFDPYSPASIVFSPNPLSISLPGGGTQTYCINLSGGSAGDVVNYKAILKNYNGDILNWCCIVDTFTVRLPECGSDPCPKIADYVVECTDDLDGDGQAEYTLDLFITGNGTINISSGCGTVSPASMSVAGPGFYTFTIFNTGNCNPFPITFYASTNNGVICAEGQLLIDLPQCASTLGCQCDEYFYDSVNLGFSATFDCPNGLFRPLDLEDCDRVFWTVNGVNVGSSVGNHTFTYTYPGVGVYEVCMRVVRTQADGTQCESKYCQVIDIALWCVPNDFSEVADAIVVSPNPVSTLLRVTWTAKLIPDRMTLRMLNAHGKEVLRLLDLEGSNGLVEIDVTTLDNGFYFLKLEGKGYSSDPIRFIKIKE